MNISRKRNVFWDHSEKHDFCQYLWKYQNSRKRYFSSKNNFLSICAKISAFRGKWRYFEITWKSRFYLIYAKISTCWGKGMYFENTLTKLFSPISPKILKLKAKVLFFRHLWKNCILSKSINISRKITLFWDNFEKVVFCQYLRRYQHFEEKEFILRSLWQNRILPISLKILKLKAKVLFFRHLWKNSFLSKNSHIPRKITLLWDYFEKIVFIPYFRKYQNSRKMYFSLDLFEK